MTGKHCHPVGQGFVGGDNRSGVTQGAKIFSRIEREARREPKRAYLAASTFRASENFDAFTVIRSSPGNGNYCRKLQF
ncbi:hypothetical protein [Mesorhizobium sp.]|uniref:hypothetical protein n=1 Tax=Mesorhizobium sp. TaxID=1871066 RepID=UPI00257A816D|nr:hypothetical protein [Mesorhizobium sp.]